MDTFNTIRYAFPTLRRPHDLFSLLSPVTDHTFLLLNPNLPLDVAAGSFSLLGEFDEETPDR